MASRVLLQPTLFEKNLILKSPEFLEASRYLDETLELGIKPGTERIEALLKELRNPHTKFETILVTGTNGKTSTSRIVSCILSGHGYKTGLYTSPHLHSYCERYAIDGKNISEKELVSSLEKMKPAIDKANNKLGDPLSNFEILTALGFYYFAKKKVDCAVLEVGMGARFDATCLTHPKVSVITNVELDHTDYLGSSIAKIATEKSFVIKEGTNVITGDLKQDAKEVIKKRSNEMMGKVSALGKDFELYSTRSLPRHHKSLMIEGLYGKYEDVEISTAGKYQAINACLALAAAELFLKKRLDLDSFRVSLKKLKFIGRLEIVRENPTVIIDGAHNPAGARNLAKALKHEFNYDKLILILAIFKDKDFKGIIEELAPLANEVIFSENSSQRCMKANELTYANNNCRIITSLAEAIKEAKKIARRDDLILITGSLATVTDARVLLVNRESNGSS